MTSAVPVLLLTHDDALWQHWRQLDLQSWLPARGHVLKDLERWQAQGRELVVMDTDLPRLPAWNESGWPARLASLKVLVASSRPNDDEARRAIAAGASGYLHAFSPVAALDRVLRNVAAGDIWMGRGLVTRLLQEVHRKVPKRDDWHAGLTAREKDIAERAAMGHGNQAIGDALGISERTVRAHLSAVFEKLSVGDRLMLALRVHGIQ